MAGRLRDAAAEGRLLTHELEERLASALRARTYGDLDALVRDLPREQQAAPRRGRLLRQRPALVFVLALVAIALACVVAAALLAFSGIWIALGIVTLVVRGRAGTWHRARPGGWRQF